MESSVWTVCRINQCNGYQDSLFVYNTVKDDARCINCGQCKKVCLNVNVIKKQSPIEWKQGWADSNIISNSSFRSAAVIIKSFIESGGYVPASLFKNGEFVYEITNDLEHAKRFDGLKYVKSNPVGKYKKVQKRLNTDKVLFIDLPCQVASLKNYMRNQERLYTIDLICHRTSLPKVLDEFWTEKKINIKTLKDIKFTTKNVFGLSDCGEYITSEGIDDYMMTFSDPMTYIDNCYECQVAKFNRVAELTLGNFWGTEYRDEEKNGVPLILIQTEKDHKLVNSSNLTIFDVDIENAKVQNHHQLQHPFIKTPERQVFLQGIVERKRFWYMTFKLYKKRINKRYIKKDLDIISWGDERYIVKNDCSFFEFIPSCGGVC